MAGGLQRSLTALTVVLICAVPSEGFADAGRSHPSADAPSSVTERAPLHCGAPQRSASPLEAEDLPTMLVNTLVSASMEAEDPAPVLEAIGQLELQAERFPNHAVTHYGIGFLMAHLGQHRAAITSLERATEIDPQFTAAHRALGSARVAVGDARGATRAYRQAVALNSVEFVAWYNLGQLSFARGDYEAALRDWGCALAADPSAVNALNNLIRAHHALGFFQAAEPLRDALREMWRVSGLAEREDGVFIDEFDVGQERVFVREVFADDDSQLTRTHYVFVCTREGQAVRTLRLESNAFDDSTAMVFAMTRAGVNTTFDRQFTDRVSYRVIRDAALELIGSVQREAAASNP